MGLLSARAILNEAIRLVDGDRRDQHGEAADLFEDVAKLWNDHLAARNESQAISASDVCVMLALLKIVRTRHGTLNMDDYVDAAGYMVLAGALALREKETPAARMAAE